MIKNSRIFKILKNFSQEEFKEFGKYLNSPFFTSREKVKDLYFLLLKHGKHKDFRSVDASFLYSKLYPKQFAKKGYSDATMRFLFNALYSACEDFLAVKSFRSKKMMWNEILREELLSKNLFEEFEVNLNKAEKYLKEMEHEGSHYLLRFNLEQDKASIRNIFLGNKINKRKRHDTYNIILGAKNLFNYFILEMTGLVDTYMKYCKQKNIPMDGNFLDCMYKSINIEPLLEFLKTVSDKNDRAKVEISEIYLAKYKAFSNMENDNYYKEYKKLFISRVNDLEIDYKHHFSTRLLDYCIVKRKMFPDNKSYAAELISVYRLIIENGLYRHSKNKNFPMDLFRNVIFAGLREGKVEWVEEFVEKFRSKLHKDMRKDAYNYAKGRLCFAKKDFKGAIARFKKMEKDYYYYAIDKKAFTIMSLYELSQYEEVVLAADSFRRYLDNTEYIPVHSKNINKKFLYYISQLVKEKHKPEKNIEGYLRMKISAEKDISNREWLLKKADELFVRKHNSSNRRKSKTSFSI